MLPSCVNTCDSDVSRSPSKRSASTLAHCLEMKVGKLRHLAALNGCKVGLMHMTKARLLQYIEHTLEKSGRLIVPDNTCRSSWLAGATKKKPKSKDVVSQMEAEGKSRSQIRAALKLHGFTNHCIWNRTKHMHRPILSWAELRKMNLNELRRFAVSKKVYVSRRRFGVPIKRCKAEILQDVMRKLKSGDRLTHAISTQRNEASQDLSGDVSGTLVSQCRAMYIPCVRKRPASALASKCFSGASQRILSGEVVSTLATFREMNINKLRHVAGLNGVRTCLGKSDGCKPRKRTKAEMLVDLERKLEEVVSLCVPGTKPNGKTMDAEKEQNGNTRTHEYISTVKRHVDSPTAR